jgi:hypothetical protein
VRVTTQGTVKLICGLAWGVLAASAWGQAAEIQTDIAPAPSARFPAAWYPPESDVTYTQPPLKGAPYSGTMVTTVHFADLKRGEIRTVTTEGLQVRDGAGRTRHEESRPRLNPNGSGKMVDVHEVSVNDPVTHCSFQWEEPWAVAGEPKASVSCMSRRLHYSGSADMYADEIRTNRSEEHPNPRQTVVTEPLGTQSMEGFQAIGVKRTLTETNPDGEPSRTTLTELWYSPVVRELMLMKISATVNGRSDALPEFALKRITIGEPDPKLFYPPPGYAILNGTR